MKLGKTAYVRFDGDRLRVSSPGAQRPFECSPHIAIEVVDGGKSIVRAIGREAQARYGTPGMEVCNPFDHPRLVAHEFPLAEKVVRHALLQMFGRFNLLPLHLIMHPLKELEGGLTDIEERLLLEIASAAGARKAAVHIGRELAAHEVVSYDFGGRG